MGIVMTTDGPVGGRMSGCYFSSVRSYCLVYDLQYDIIVRWMGGEANSLFRRAPGEIRITESKSNDILSSKFRRHIAGKV